MALLENGAVDDVPDVLLVPLGEPQHRLGVALGGVEDARAVRVLADALEQGGDGALHAVEAQGGLLLGLADALARAAAGPAQAVKVDEGALGAVRQAVGLGGRLGLALVDLGLGLARPAVAVAAAALGRGFIAQVAAWSADAGTACGVAVVVDGRGAIGQCGCFCCCWRLGLVVLALLDDAVLLRLLVAAARGV